MEFMDIELKTIQIQNEKIVRAIEDVHNLLTLANGSKSKEKEKEFYTIEDCAELKGGAAVNTYKCNRFLLPGCGNPRYSVHIAGRLCFPRGEVEKWLKVTDAEYIEYAKECGVTTIPEKYVRLSRKAGGKEIC